MGWGYVCELLPLADSCSFPRWRVTVEWYIDRGKPKNSEKNLSQCYFVHHKSHTVANPGLRGQRPETNHLGHGTAASTWGKSRFCNVWLITSLQRIVYVRILRAVIPLTIVSPPSHFALRNTCMSSYKVPVMLAAFNKTGTFQRILVLLPSLKCNWNPFSGWLVTSGQTDWQTEWRY
jgi:hypothetical protein